MKCIINGRIVLADQVLSGYAILFDETIKAIVPESEVDVTAYDVIDAKGNLVAPGLVDIHIHGYLGEDASDGSAEGLKKMAAGVFLEHIQIFNALHGRSSVMVDNIKRKLVKSRNGMH